MESAPQPSRLVLIFVPLVGLLFALGIIEVGFRLAETRITTPKWQDRPKRYVMPADAPNLRGNSPSRKGVFSIAVVGDSITFGPYLQADDTFPKRLERTLSTNPQAPTVVNNFGTSGFSTAQEVAVVRKVLQNKPNLVLLQITLNDPELAPLREGKGAFAPYEPSWFIKKIWRSGGFLLNRVHTTRMQQAYTQYFFDLFSRPETKDRFIRALEEIVNLCREAKVPLVWTVFPLFGTPINESYPFYPLHDEIARHAARHSVPLVDLTDQFKNIPPERLQVIPGVDLHPNEIAHRIAADKLYEFLARNSLLPDEIKAKRTTRMPRLNYLQQGMGEAIVAPLQNAVEETAATSEDSQESFSAEE